ncbi:MAG: lipoyl domain-containing protein [Gammaproteobacteria bacterium]|nr:lipoyl domain-containing protein [Gammaproteobacteria bacterium]
MARYHEVRLPGLPDCWETCGNCGDGELTVVEIHVAPGDALAIDTPVLVVETDKTTLDIAADRAGTVVEVAVGVGDRVAEGQLLLRIATADPGA